MTRSPGACCGRRKAGQWCSKRVVHVMGLSGMASSDLMGCAKPAAHSWNTKRALSPQGSWWRSSQEALQAQKLPHRKEGAQVTGTGTCTASPEVLFLKGWRITPSFYAPCSKLRHSGGKLTVVLQTSPISEISQICCLVCSQHLRNHSRKWSRYSGGSLGPLLSLPPAWLLRGEHPIILQPHPAWSCSSCDLDQVYLGSFALSTTPWCPPPRSDFHIPQAAAQACVSLPATCPISLDATFTGASGLPLLSGFSVLQTFSFLYLWGLFQLAKWPEGDM